jgi:predicted dehydrogenase
VKYGLDTQEAQLKADMSPNDPAYGIDPTPCLLFDGDTGSCTEIPSPRGDQRAYYSGVRDAILQGGPAPVTARDAVAVMAILETSFASGASGQLLPLPLTPSELAEWGR